MIQLTIADCGDTNDGPLRNILNNIISSKIEAGENVTLRDKDDIEMQIVAAYQTVLETLSQLGTPEFVPQAIKQMEKIIENNPGAYTEMAKNAENIAINVCRDEGQQVGSDDELDKVITPTASVVFWGEVDDANTVEMKKIDFNIEANGMAKRFGTEENDKEYEKTMGEAESGDVNSQNAIKLINKATKLFGRVGGKKEKECAILALRYIAQLRMTGHLMALKTAEHLAEAYKLDVFDIDENGNKTINDDKVTKEFETRNSNSTSKQPLKERAKVANERTEAKKFDANDYKVSYSDLIKDSENVECVLRFGTALRSIRENGNNQMAIEELVQNNPEVAKEYLKQMLKRHSKALSQKEPKMVAFYERDILLLNDFVKKYAPKIQDSQGQNQEGTISEEELRTTIVNSGITMFSSGEDPEPEI